jgi:hypothetical protein
LADADALPEAEARADALPEAEADAPPDADAEADGSSDSSAADGEADVPPPVDDDADALGAVDVVLPPPPHAARIGTSSTTSRMDKTLRFWVMGVSLVTLRHAHEVSVTTIAIPRTIPAAGAG